MPKRNAGNENNFLAMSVENVGFLLDRLGQDCHPLQFLRELTQNSIEAITRAGGKGEIIWDVDWTTFEQKGVFKLSITDNGDGMAGEEMVKFINHLSSSGSIQSMSGNYGVGAKITTATRNQFGVVYLSWKKGEGAMIEMFKDPVTHHYGLRQWERKKSSTFHHFLPLEDDVKPDLIDQHGTKVILQGMYEEANTMEAPPGSPSPSRWISKYLNTRYFELPKGIVLKAREGWEYLRSDKDRNYLRNLTGQKYYLNGHSETKGLLNITEARVHWWILKDETAITNNSGYIESAGHIAALYQNELYEQNSGRSGMARLQQFGVIFGYRNVVIYVEPIATEQLTTNTARTSLLLNNEPLPWNDWAAEFREHMPAAIAKLVEEKAAASANTDHQKSIKDRLKNIMELFTVSRYKPAPAGNSFIDEINSIRGGSLGNQNKNPGKRNPTKENMQGGSGGNVYAIYEKIDGTQAQKINPDPFPKVLWVSIENGTREPKDMEDRAAKFLQDQNILLINQDFSVFKDMRVFFRKEFSDSPGLNEVAEESIKGWFEQALVETVLGVQGLMNRKDWTQAHIEAALSQEALTAAVMQRYHLHNAIKRELGQKMGSLKNQVVTQS